MKTSDQYRIALVHATYNPVSLINSYIQKNAPDLKPVNYLDGALMNIISREGGINQHSMRRFLDLLTKACEDEPDGIILTCTVFSPYQKAFQALFQPPIICADAAMLNQLSLQKGKTAILCTFDGTVETTRRSYISFCQKNGTDESVDMFTVPEAFAAINSGDLERSNALIQEKLHELDSDYDSIALAQMSMSGATDGYTPNHARVLTSPACAIEQLRLTLAGK